MSLIEKRFDAVYKNALLVPFDKNSKFIIMSDCHRGQGNAGDNFLNNQNLFFGALRYYFDKGFTYIELGDGDELWENRKIEQIINVHSDAFWMMSQFYKEKRLYMLHGNHDIVKRRRKFVRKNLSCYYQNSVKRHMELFPGITIPEGLILENTENKKRIFLAHGNQGSLTNDYFWPLGRFMVRYVWKTLELVGFLDPTGAGREHKKYKKSDKAYNAYAVKHDRITILGHTHRPVFPQPSQGLYFNDGSCVHPRCITGIEIENDAISLMKWSTQIKKDGTLFIGREVLEGPVPIKEYYQYIW